MTIKVKVNDDFRVFFVLLLLLLLFGSLAKE